MEEVVVKLRPKGVKQEAGRGWRVLRGEGACVRGGHSRTSTKARGPVVLAVKWEGVCG